MPASFQSFEQELNRLVGIFERNLTHYKSSGYDEASLRQEFFNLVSTLPSRLGEIEPPRSGMAL